MEGKPSWLIAYITKQLTQDETNNLIKTLYIPRDRKTEKEVQWVHSLLEHKGALKAGKQFLSKNSEVFNELKSEYFEYQMLIDDLIQLIQLSEKQIHGNPHGSLT